MLDRLAEVQHATARIAQRPAHLVRHRLRALDALRRAAEVIRRFREAQPTVEVGLFEMTTVEQIEALKAGRIDVGFGRLRFDDDDIVGELVTRGARGRGAAGRPSAWRGTSA